MPNPKAPRVVRVAHQSESLLEHFLRRLVKLGVEQSDLDDVRAHWDDFNEDWTPEKRRELVSMTDVQLREGLAERDDEYDFSTTTGEDDARQALEHAVAQAEVAASDKMSGTIPQIMEWVGGDRARAMAALNLEQSPDGGNRVTLVAALNEIVAGAA